MKAFFSCSLILLCTVLSASCQVKLADSIANTTSSASPNAVPVTQVETLGQMDFRRVLSGDKSNVRNYETRVIDNETDFIKLWDDHIGSKTNPLFVPKIDFQLKNVIAVFLGERPTTGFSTEVNDIMENKDSVVVKVSEKKPAAGTEVKAEITQPFLIIETKKSNKRFIVENTSSNISKSEEIKFTNVEAGYDSGIKEFSKRLAKTDKEFADLYKEHLSAQKTVNATVFPTIDFKNNMVAGIFLGERPSSGYNIEIKRVLKTETQIVIEASEVPPAKTASVIPIINTPYEFISLPKSDLPIKFDINVIVPESGSINETPSSSSTTSKDLVVKAFINGENTNIENPQYLILQNKAQFKNIWMQHTGSSDSLVPDVDLDNNSLIAVFSGPKDSSGYTVNVSSAVELNDELRVFVDLTKDLSQARNIRTSPFSMVLIPKTYKNPTFIINNTVTD